MHKDSETVEIGRVVGVHGVKGEIKVLPFGGDIASLGIKELFLNADGEEETLQIEGIRSHKGMLLLTLAGISSREAAEALKGRMLSLRRDTLPEAAPGEYYHFDLLGLTVVTEDGSELGKLTEIIETGSNDVYQIEGEAGELLLPAIDDVILLVDIAGGTMTVRPIEEPGGKGR